MNFLADEDVEKPVVEMLRHEGHDVLYMCEIATRTIDEKLLDGYFTVVREGKIRRRPLR